MNSIIIIEHIQNDKGVNMLLNQFRSEFLDIYNKLCKKEKDLFLEIGDEFYRRWLYSPLVLETYINPNYIINNIAQNYCKGTYTIQPHITIKKNEDEGIIFSTKYLYFSSEEHPIFNDIVNVIENINPVLLLEKCEDNEIKFDSKLLDKLEFKSPYYKEYLMELLERLKVIKKMKAIGCRCYQIDKNYKDFCSLNNNDKLSEIVTETINMVCDALNNINFIEGLITKDSIIKNLNYGMTETRYLDVLKEINLEDRKFINDINRFSTDISLRLDNNIGILEMQGFSDMADFIIGREIKKEYDRCFTTVFGYYLGIITPNYGKPFLAYEIAKGAIEAKDTVERQGYLFDCDNIHDLTSLGKELLKIYELQYNEEYFKAFNINDLVAVINTAKTQRRDLEIMYKKEKKQMLLNMKY